MSEVIISIFALTGSAAVLLAAVGLVRFPDFFTRVHAATKASAFGLAALMVAVCIAFPGANMVGKALFALVALFLTLPVASQALGEAARKDDGAASATDDPTGGTFDTSRDFL